MVEHRVPRHASTTADDVSFEAATNEPGVLDQLGIRRVIGHKQQNNKRRLVSQKTGRLGGPECFASPNLVERDARVIKIEIERFQGQTRIVDGVSLSRSLRLA